MTRRTRWVAVLAVLMTAASLAPAAATGGSARTYSVTITNLTDGQWLTPPLTATHQRSVRLFDVGRAASEGIKEIAENGNLGPLQSALEGNRRVADVVVAVAGDPPPLGPGQTVTFQIDGSRSARWLSYASMLICTNDGFTGVDRLRLPTRVGRTEAAASFAYDAGTEINTESFEDIVPPCPVLSGQPSSFPGAGMSNPALAENGVITHHAGITTSGVPDKLSADIQGWDTGLPVAVITVTRTG